MKQMLRKRDVIDALNVPKSTVSDWIIEFHMFIPTDKVGSVTYYRPDSISVLQEIKKLREENYSKPEILRELRAHFPITVDVAVAEEIGTRLDQDAQYSEQLVDPRLLDEMKLARRFVSQHSVVLQQHHVRLNNQDHQLADQSSAMLEMQKDLEEIKAELAATKELLRKKRRWWQRR